MIRQAAIEAARTHPADFGALLFPETDQGTAMEATTFHREWLELCCRIDRLLLLAPRGHAKSEWITGALALWLIGQNPHIRLLVLAADEDLAKTHTERIRELLVSPQFSELFPDCPKVASNTKQQIKLAVPGAHATWRAEGINAITAGPRADVIILDDVVNKKNSRTATLRADLYGTYTKVIRGMLVPDGRIIAVGTPYYEGDLYYLLEALTRPNGQPLYTTVRYDAFVDDETPLWPERFSLESLQQARIEMGELDFFSQLRCTIKPDDGEVFKVAWFEQLTDIPQLTEVWLLADTATSETPGADYTVLLTMGRDVTGLMYVLDVQREKWEPGKAQTELVSALKVHRATYGSAFRGLAFENTKENMVFSAWLKQAGLGQAKILQHGGLSKYERARAVIARCENDQVKFRQAHWNGLLFDELKGFTKDGGRQHDDLVDALVYGIALIVSITFTLQTKPGPLTTVRTQAPLSRLRY